MKPFTKAALSTGQQLQRLLERGMHVADTAGALHTLSHINYYRLRGYWLPFETAGTAPHPAPQEHRFAAGVDFDTVVGLYNFDRELRLLLLDAIERVEISLRTRMANELTMRYGPLAHDDAAHFARRDTWQHGRDELHKEYVRSRETFAEHYRRQYPQLSSPPLWVACELMSLGHLSRWLQNLARPKDRQAIANAYALDEKVLVSFVHHLSIVRNHCAHHGRVWNRKFAIQMLIPTKKPAGLAVNFHPGQGGHLYNTLVMLLHFMDAIAPRHSWRQRLKALLERSRMPIGPMGFPEDWTSRPLWQEARP